MSDRQDEVLNAIDSTLSGYTDSDPISLDAMRWSPREDEEQTIEVEGGAKVTFFSDGYSILDEHLYVEATGRLYPHPPPRPTDQFSFIRAASGDSIPDRPSSPAEGNEEPTPTGPDLAATTADWAHAVLGGEADRLHPWQMRMLSDTISAGPGRMELETRGRNVMGPRGFVRSGDSIPARLSPGEVSELAEAGVSAAEAARAIAAAVAGPTPEEIVENIRRLSEAMRVEGDIQ